MPPNVAWARPSERNDRPRCTMKTPRSPPAPPITVPARRARRMKPCARGSVRKSTSVLLAEPGPIVVVVVRREGRLVLEAGEGLLGGAPGDEPAVEVGHAIGELPHRREVVGHEDRRQVLPVRHPGDEIEELGPPPAVNPPRRVDEEQELRLDHASPGQ